MLKGRGNKDEAKTGALLAGLEPKLRDKLEPLLACRMPEGGAGPVWSLEATNVEDLAFEDIAKLLAAKLPVAITRLQIANRTWKGKTLGALVDHPAFAAITELDLSGCEQIGDGIDALAASKHAAGLRALSLSRCKLRPRHVEEVRDSKTLQLTELDIEANDLGEDGAKIVCGAKQFARLRRLSCGGNHEYDSWTDGLAKTKHLGGLEALDVRAVVSKDTAFGPSPEGWLRFAKSKAFGALRSLGLRGHSNFEDPAAVAFAANPAFASLHELDLVGIGMTMEGFEAIAASKHVKPTRILMSGYKPIAKAPTLFPAGVAVVV